MQSDAPQLAALRSRLCHVSRSQGRRANSCDWARRNPCARSAAGDCRQPALVSIGVRRRPFFPVPPFPPAVFLPSLALLLPSYRHSLLFVHCFSFLFFFVFSPF